MIEEENLTPQETPEEEQKENVEIKDASRPEETPDTPEALEMPSHPLVDDTKDLSGTPTEVEEKTLEESETQKEPSKFQQLMRKVLIWLGVVIAAALAGFLAFYFAFYRPQAAELETVTDDLNSANSRIATQDATFADVQDKLTTLESAEFHAALLDISTDVYAARLALTEDNTVAAKAALVQTEGKVTAIQDELAAFDAKLANDLPQRLRLIRSGIDSDIENAIADCDILLDDLSEAEAALMP